MCHNGIIHESNVRFGVLLCMVTRFYGKKKCMDLVKNTLSLCLFQGQ